MEYVRSICVMRDLVRALAALEDSLATAHGLSLNEAMVLCVTGYERVTPSFICQQTGLSPSNTSKVTSSLERKKYLVRRLGKEDRRQMFFSLTPQGKELLEALKTHQFDIPELLRSCFEGMEPVCPERVEPTPSPAEE